MLLEMTLAEVQACVVISSTADGLAGEALMSETLSSWKLAVLEAAELILSRINACVALSRGVGNATPSTVPVAATGCREESSVVLETDRRLGVFVIRSSPIVTARDVRRTR